MTRYQIYIGITVLQIAVLVGLYLHSQITMADSGRQRMEAETLLVRNLSLTDVSVWTEARYSRHPSQADFFTPFQDFPSSLEHFPAGSIIAPHRMASMQEKIPTDRE